MVSGNKKKIYIQISAVCIGICAYVHATFLVAGFWAKLYTGNILLLTKNRRSKFFCLLLKETWICFNHSIVWQLLHRKPVLCLNISTPSHSVHFPNLPSKLSLLENCTPLRNPAPLPGRNKRSVPKGHKWFRLNLRENIVLLCEFCDRTISLSNPLFFVHLFSLLGVVLKPKSEKQSKKAHNSCNKTCHGGAKRVHLQTELRSPHITTDAGIWTF